MSGQALALDIGGSHVTAALVDLERRGLVGRPGRRTVHPDADTELLLGAWAGTALEALGSGTAPLRIGIAMPSPFEYRAGVSRMTHKFNALYGLNVRDGLRARWAGTPLDGVPMAFGNDADLFALGEWWGGAGRGARRMIGVTLGTGLGSGFVADGRAVTDGREVPPGGELWNTPYRDGAAEDFASGRAVTRAYRRRSSMERSAAEVAALADRGDPEARAAYAELGADLGHILAPWVTRFRPDCLVIGGNVARAWGHFGQPLRAALPGLDCRPATTFEDSGLLGAAVLQVVA